MHRYLFIVLLLFLPIYSCTTAVDTDNQIKISVYDDAQRLIDEMFNPLRIEPLNTRGDTLMMPSGKIEMFDGNIYIQDTYRHRISVYNSEGLFIKVLDRNGRGPDEYAMISDFCVSKPSGEIFILDSFSSCLLVYDTNFSFIKKIALPSAAINNFLPINDTIFALYSSYKGLVHLYNCNSKESYSELKISEEGVESLKGISARESVFRNYNGEALLLAAIQKRIYKITPQGFELKYTFSFGEDDGDAFSLPKFEITNREQIEEFRNTKKVYSIIDFIETSDYLILSYNIPLTTFYDKQSHISYTFDRYLDYSVVDYKGQRLLSVFPAYSILYVVDMGLLDNADSDEIEAIRKLSDETHPILCSYSFK